MPGQEREDTDARLLEERTKTDDELVKTRVSAEDNADQVLEVARNRAEETIRIARERSDQEMIEAGAPRRVRQEVAIERATEDGAVAEEQAVADHQLRVEREDRQRALSALLFLERGATDDGLVIERARADEVLATRDNFLGMVSHDLRNLLGGIALTAAVLAKPAKGVGDEDAARIGHAKRIQLYTARMNRLVGDLLDVVSLEAGRLHVTLQQFDAIQVLQDAAETFRPSFAAKGITLTTKTPAGSLPAALDHDRILQVLSNILSNALKFTEPGGEVVLLVERSGSEVSFSVTDTGVGIPAGQATAIFERFRQVSPKDRRGLGLGLYIANCIVEAHGGRIWAESRQTGGTALHFTLPSA